MNLKLLRNLFFISIVVAFSSKYQILYAVDDLSFLKDIACTNPKSIEFEGHLKAVLLDPLNNKYLKAVESGDNYVLCFGPNTLKVASTISITNSLNKTLILHNLALEKDNPFTGTPPHQGFLGH